MKFRKIYIELSDICGLKCSFCPSYKNIRGVMSLELFERCLYEASKHTKLITYHILGDPLYISNLNDYLTLTKKYNLYVELTTSGVYLKDFSMLLNPPIRQVNISLDAILDLNSDVLIDKYLKRVFQFCNFKQDISSNTFINLRIQNIKRNIDLINMINKEFRVNINSNITNIGNKIRVIIKNRFKWVDSDMIDTIESGFCYALTSHIGILSNGNVVPCCIDVSGKVILGNIKSNTIKNIMQTNRAKNMKEGFINNCLIEDICKVCDYRKRFEK